MNNYIMTFYNEEQEKIILVCFQDKNYFDAEEHAAKYKRCLGDKWVFWGNIYYTDKNPNSPPYLDATEEFMTIEQLVKHPDYKKVVG